MPIDCGQLCFGFVWIVCKFALQFPSGLMNLACNQDCCFLPAAAATCKGVLLPQSQSSPSGSDSSLRRMYSQAWASPVAAASCRAVMRDVTLTIDLAINGNVSTETSFRSKSQCSWTYLTDISLILVVSSVAADDAVLNECTLLRN